MSQSEPGVIVVADDDADVLDLVALTLERGGRIEALLRPQPGE